MCNITFLCHIEAHTILLNPLSFPTSCTTHSLIPLHNTSLHHSFLIITLAHGCFLWSLLFTFGLIVCLVNICHIWTDFSAWSFSWNPAFEIYHRYLSSFSICWMLDLVWSGPEVPSLNFNPVTEFGPSTSLKHDEHF